MIGTIKSITINGENYPANNDTCLVKESKRFIERNAKGKIIASFACKQYENQEQISNNHPDYLKFIYGKGK